MTSLSDTTPTPAADPTGNDGEPRKDQDQDSTTTSTSTPTTATDGTMVGTQQARTNGDGQDPNHRGDRDLSEKKNEKKDQPRSRLLSAGGNGMVSDYHQAHSGGVLFSCVCSFSHVLYHD
jgi:hypothetical protein